MKRSNIILMSMIAISLLLTGVLTLVTARKFDNKDFQYVGRDANYQIINLPAFKIVSLKAIRGMKILTSDSAKLEIQNEKKDRLFLNNSGDTLFLQSVFNEIDTGKNSMQLVLYLPSDTQINMDSCQVELKGDPDPAHPSSFVISLSASELSIAANDIREFFKTLTIIDRGSSAVQFAESTFAENVTLVNVHNARFTNGFHIQNLVTSANALARVD